MQFTGGMDLERASQADLFAVLSLRAILPFEEKIYNRATLDNCSKDLK